ncbi:AAA family ATPase [Halobacillus sp. ACCC02827]|nr:AAA family ATPase [Halobacillus sp. ACCC02827]WJE14030.1 AAA family ATPase [Halobacillus sp. ACCC02827]
MKALAIRMGAFGPYRNEQVVDFTMLGGESIFLITGPTGAGKTTIFDAMCFALYGRASGSDRDQDTMRSHFAHPNDPTFVEFSFELRGKTYRVVRMPKQTRKKERGEGFKEDPARAELFLLTNDQEQLVASKVKEVNEYIEEIIGLDYEQFRKMIMIPQGEFRKLISENSKEREEILQRIFKTKFFDDITEYFKTQSKQLEEEIKQFEWKIEQERNQVVWEDQEATYESEELSRFNTRLDDRLEKQETLVAAEKEAVERLEIEVDEWKKRYHHSEQLLELFEEKALLDEEKHALDQKHSEVEKTEKELQAARRAAEITPYEKQYKERMEEWQKWQKSYEDKLASLKTIREEFHQIDEAYHKLSGKEEEREQLKSSWEQAVEEQENVAIYNKLLEDSKAYTTSIATKEKKLGERKEALGKCENRAEELKNQRRKERETSDSWYEAKQRIDVLYKRLEGLRQLQEHWRKLEEMRRNYQSFMKQYKNAEVRQQSSKQAYEDSLEEIRHHHAYTLSLKLEEDTPCPVCGSSDHPRPVDRPLNVPAQEELDRLKQVYQEDDAAYQEMQRQLVTVTSAGEAQRQLTEKAMEEWDGYVKTLDEQAIQRAIIQSEEDLKAAEQRFEELDAMWKSLTEAAKELEQVEERSAKLRSAQEETRSRLHEEEQQHVKILSKVQAMEENYAFSSTDVTTLKEKAENRRGLYVKALNEWEELKEKHRTKKEQLQQLTTAVEEGGRYLEDLDKAVKKSKKQLDQTLVQFSFHDHEAYKQAVRSPGFIAENQRIVDDYEKRKSIVKDRVKDLDQRLADKHKPDLEELQSLLDEKRRILAIKQEAFNERSAAYRKNREIREKINMLMDDQGELASKYYDIAELAQLAKGDNHLRLSLERYVLASYLDEILVQANVRLDQMTDHRYQLIRSDAVAKRGAQSGLDLEIIDHHTGKQRSVRTLSGGEGFKTSLSLALGMADVVQAHAGGVQLDTLFIDEGFGTLDEISLEQAISCLRSLQDGNRLLGIISHVPQLKEEIPAKLQIRAGVRGSTLEFTFQ